MLRCLPQKRLPGLYQGNWGWKSFKILKAFRALEMLWNCLDLRLCLVLHIPQPFLCNPDHLGGMRLGFGAAGLKAWTTQPFWFWSIFSSILGVRCVNVPCFQGAERKERLESILAHIKQHQGEMSGCQMVQYNIAIWPNAVNFQCQKAWSCGQVIS